MPDRHALDDAQRTVSAASAVTDITAAEAVPARAREMHDAERAASARLGHHREKTEQIERKRHRPPHVNEIVTSSSSCLPQISTFGPSDASRTHPSSSSSSKSSMQLPNTDADADDESTESERLDADEDAFDDSENGMRPPKASANGVAAEPPSRAVSLGDACARAGCCALTC